MKLTNDIPPTTDLASIQIWNDGSKNAANQERENLDAIQEREDCLKLLRLFIAKHRMRLAGLWWRACTINPRIEIHCSRQSLPNSQHSPYDIAARWEGVSWKRITPEYQPNKSKSMKDWVGKVDGVSLHIQGAEVYDLMPVPGDGEIVLPDRPSGKTEAIPKET